MLKAFPHVIERVQNIRTMVHALPGMLIIYLLLHFLFVPLSLCAHLYGQIAGLAC